MSLVVVIIEIGILVESATSEERVEGNTCRR